MHGAALGMFSLIAIVSAESNFSETAAVCIVLATALAIAGRNYGSPRMVIILIVALTFPMALGFILRGDFYHVTLGLLSAPFLLAVHRYAVNIRDTLFAALGQEAGEQHRRTLQPRAEHHVARARHARPGRAHRGGQRGGRAPDVAEKPDALLGRSVHSLLMRGVAGRMLTPNDCRYVEAQLTRALREGRDRKVLVSFANGQHYEFSAREGSQELGVITFEDVTARVEAEERSASWRVSTT